MSSLSFLGDATSYLNVPNTTEFNFGTGDFTIEWYQYQTDTNSYPRIFHVGSYQEENLSIGVSIEGGLFYYWTNGTPNAVAELNSTDYKNKWVHFAICRSSGSTKIFMDGISIYTMSDENDFNGSCDLTIANESTPSDNAAFGGYIAYFSWIKGLALRTNDFTVPTSIPTATSAYVLLLKASGFSGTLGNTVTNNNVTTVNNEPFSTTTITTTTITTTTTTTTLTNLEKSKPLFSNNSLVFYKRGSLASCGVGSVRNLSVKSRRI